MSIQFKKPKKRMQMRVLTGNEDDDYDNNINAMDVDKDIPPAPPPPIINKNHKMKQHKTKQTLLSFGDEVEEDEGVFQVKKSSQSKKLMKMMDRERRGIEVKQDKDKKSSKKQEKQNMEEGKMQHQGDINSRNNDSYNKASKSIEGIILTGRAAVSALRCGDVSGSEDEEDEEEENSHLRALDADDDVANVEGAERFRHAFVKHSGMSVRALLDSGGIPDAAVIHAARKKRQQARQVGEFIPIQSTRDSNEASSPHTVGSGSRLVREDGEGDGSDEDPDRIDVKGVHLQHTKRERIKMAATHNGSDPDSGGEEWETQQIRKAVTHSQIIAAQQETYYNNAYVMPTLAMGDVEINPFAIAPAAVTEQSLTNEHLKPLAAGGQPVLTPQHLADVLRSRLNVLVENKLKIMNDYETMSSELEKLKEKQESCEVRAPNLAIRYEFYQKLRAYITDLIECLDEKMPDLIALESRAMTLHRRKAAFLIERRRADVRDQAQEVLQPIAGKKDVKDEERSRRCAEREGRRLRRRRTREKDAVGASAKHREGESSDDEVPQTEMVAYQSIQDQIVSDASLVFSDALEEFSTLAGVLSKMEEWRKQDMPAYVEAYAGMCLPKLIGPFLRLKLLLWNPITDEDAVDWEKMQWYRGLMLYGLTESLETERNLSEDPDITMIPNVVFKIIIPKLTELVEGTWDPVSSSQTRRLTALLRRAATLPGPGPNSKNMTALADAIIKRAQTALQHDVFIPILPKSVVDITGSGKNGAPLFLRRQAAMGVKLLGNLASLHGTVADTALAPLALTALLQRYLLPALRCCPSVYGAELCWAIASCLPKVWLSNENEQSPIQQFISVCQEVQSQLTDNPIHIKPLDLVRSSITILKGGAVG